MTTHSYLLLIIGLAAHSLVIKAQTTLGVSGSTAAGACELWKSAANTNYGGGTVNNASTIDACQSACISSSTCVAIDWNPSASAGSQCWTMTSLSGQKFSGGNSGITHYDLNRLCLGATCTNSWTSFENTNYAGGNENAASTISDCRNACINNASCIAIDWNPNGQAGRQCFLLTSLSGQKFTGYNSGITHSDLTRSCSSGPTYRILMGRPNEAFGVAFIDSSNRLEFSSDYNQATLFAEVPCLAATVPGFNYTQNCVSWYSVDNPGFYLRNLYGTVTLQPRSVQLFANQFALDASFYVTPDKFIQGYAAVQPVAWPTAASASAYYFYSASFLQADNFRYSSITASFGLSTYTTPSTAVTGFCPNTWTRIKGVRSDGTSVPFSSVADCRRTCLLTPNCIGISVSSVCIMTTNATISLYPSQGYSYFELAKSYPWSCARGCSYTWTVQTLTLQRARLSSWQISASSCRQQCVNSYSSCSGILWNNNGTVNNCVLYYNDSFTTNNITVTLMVPTALSRSCGPCDPTVFIVLFMADSNAVLQTGVTNETSCRTACINNRMCKGFELDITNDNCFFCFTSDPILSTSTTRHHFDIFKSFCGNGCQDKWDFYNNTRMPSATVKSDLTTDRACRQGCQADASCFKIDWYPANSTCYFGSSSTPISLEGTSPGWYHYEIYPSDYCDEDSN